MLQGTMNALMSYLDPRVTATPGSAGNELWALIYIFIIFAGVALTVMWPLTGSSARRWPTSRCASAPCASARTACYSPSPTPSS